MTEERTLIVRLGDGTETSAEMRNAIRAMERGEDVEEKHVLVLDDEADLQRLLSPTNLELLRALREHEPESMRAAAAIVGRDYKDVHRNLTELETLNVIEFEQEGRSKRPVVRFDEIDVEVSLHTSGTDVAPA